MKQRKSLLPEVSIRSRLVTLVLVSIFPVLIFAGSLAAYLTYRQIDSVEQGLKGTTKALTGAIDRQLGTVISTLQVLMETEEFELDEPHLKSLHRRLVKAISSQVDWTAISYSDVNGIQYFNTSMPFGAKLPSFKGQPFFEKALETGRVSISGYRVGLVTKKQMISIAIPVKRKDKVDDVLIASIETSSLSKTLQAQNLPAEWTASILDSDSLIIARSRHPEKYLGKKATTNLAQESREKYEDFFDDSNMEGRAAHGSFNRSAISDWTIAIGVPKGDFVRETWHTFWIILVGAILFVGAGITLAFIMGSRISQPILALAGQARMIGKGKEMDEIDTTLPEVIEVSNALRQAAADRDESLKKAQDAIELRDTFLSIASHELKTPITALQLNLQIIQKEHNSKPLERALQQIKRLTHLIDELLDVSRITSGKMQLSYEEIDLCKMIEEIIAEFADTNIKLISSEKIIGEWDRNRLEQIITNLISNAIKYGEKKPVTITLSRTADEVMVAVQDQGMGIKPEDQSRIFERFERAVHQNTISGLGLGLWISNQIVKSFNGSIQLNSEVGVGTTFTLILPTKPIVVAS